MKNIRLAPIVGVLALNAIAFGLLLKFTSVGTAAASYAAKSTQAVQTIFTGGQS